MKASARLERINFGAKFLAHVFQLHFHVRFRLTEVDQLLLLFR